jgi:hypothetical protein
MTAAVDDESEHEDLAALLASWNTETPIPDEIRQQVQRELDEVGLRAMES